MASLHEEKLYLIILVINDIIINLSTRRERRISSLKIALPSRDHFVFFPVGIRSRPTPASSNFLRHIRIYGTPPEDIEQI